MISRASLLVAVAAFAIAIFYAAVADSYAVFLIATISLTAIACIGLNVLLGLAGQISLGHIGFMAIGAYTTVLLMEKAGWPYLAATAGAIVLATCNRVEIYAEADGAGVEAARAGLLSAVAASTSLPDEDVHAAFRTLDADATARHLFEVGAGLDSAVVGEREIAGEKRLRGVLECSGHKGVHFHQAIAQDLKFILECGTHRIVLFSRGNTVTLFSRREVNVRKPQGE